MDKDNFSFQMPLCPNMELHCFLWPYSCYALEKKKKNSPYFTPDSSFQFMVILIDFLVYERISYLTSKIQIIVINLKKKIINK